MSGTRVVVLSGGVALLAAWFSSAAGTVQAPGETGLAPGVAPVAQTATPPAARFDLQEEVGRLAARLDQAPRPRSPARNPFTLTSRARVAGPQAAPVPVNTPAPAVVVDGLPAAPPPPPALSLAGIGVERMPYGRQLTAIVSAEGRVFLARAGDELMGRFQVRIVSDDAVELFDLRDAVSLHLTLP
jgi:hypothetical protein